MSTTTCTTCPYCGVGCGVVVEESEQGVSVTGDSAHPANGGLLCLKGSSLAETLGADHRLARPQLSGEDVSWAVALDTIAEKFSACIEQHGPESIAFYVSGQLLIEDYYVVNKFVKGYLGTANIDTNSRLCMASSVAAHKRAFGADVVPGCYDDFDHADLVVLVGSNLAWCHPVLNRRLSAARQNNSKMRIINIDPRRTATAEMADTQLSIAADADVDLFNGLLNYLIDHGKVDIAYVAQYTTGLTELAQAVGEFDIHSVASATELTVEEVVSFYRAFAEADRVVTVYSQGVNQSSSGTDKVNAIINCHLATGKIGRQGSGPFSVTGQPNAMGGREVGGLANMLACHMDLDNTEHRKTLQSFWQSPAIASAPGLKAVELFEAVADGRIKAIWIMATNPVDSMPNADQVAEALQTCDFVVQSDIVMSNDTAQYAHVRLPAQAWGEKDGTVTNSERCISRQRRFSTPLAEARPDWWAVAEVAARLGFADAFDYSDPAQIFAEYATLSGFRNTGRRAFDISACADMTAAEYAAMRPFYWPARLKLMHHPTRFFSSGGYFHADRRARFIVPQSRVKDLPSGTFRLNSGRVRDHWHTMTRTGYTASLSRHIGEPFVEIHPDDACELGLSSADIARVYTPQHACTLRVLVTDRVRRGTLFAPMHWNLQFANRSRVCSLVSSDTDPFSGQPALKHAQVAIEKIAYVRFGFIVARREIDLERFDYAARARCHNGWRYEVAALTSGALEEVLSKALQSSASEILQIKSASQYRCAGFDGEQLVFAGFLDDRPVELSRRFITDALADSWPDRAQRHRVLAGRDSDATVDQGVEVCNCLGVGTRTIEAAVVQGGCSVSAIGDATGAGTNCGSCRGEIAAIINRLRVPAVA